MDCYGLIVYLICDLRVDIASCLDVKHVVSL